MLQGVFLLFLLLLLLTAIELSLGGSSPYTSTDKTIQKHSANNSKHNKYKYKYYKNTHTIVKTPPNTHTHTHTHTNITKQVKTITAQDTHQMT